MSDLKTLVEQQKSLSQKVMDFIGKFSKQLKFAEVTTTDGKVLTYDGELAAGTAVTIDGAAAADGAYTLEDGTVCNVKEGVIESVVKPEANDADYAEKFAAMEERVKGVEAKFADEITGIMGKFEEIGGLIKTITDGMGKQLEAVSKFAAQTAEPAEPPANRKMAKIEKEVTTGKNINQILDEINKAKTS